MDRILVETGFQDSRSVSIPMEAGILAHVISNPSPTEENDQSFVTQYASYTGQCIYPSCITRIDTAFASGV